MKEDIKNIRNALIKDIIKNSGNEYGATVNKSEILNNRDLIPTGIPGLNVALSGDVDVGYRPGCMQIVGDSKTFKTMFLLFLAKAYLDAHDDAVVILFDSEKGASLEYFKAVGIDMERVIHLPIVSIEDLTLQMNGIIGKDKIKRGQRIFLAVDSIGLLPSEKEVDDAEDGKTTADMTRARKLNSFWRIAMMKVALLDIPLVVINHAYDTIGSMFASKVIKGGKVGYLAANEIWMISRSKEKDGTELIGYNFNIRIEKSRFVKEGSIIPITVTYDGGIDYYSSLLDLAVESKHIVKPKNGSYQLPGTEKVVKEEKTGPLLDVVLKDETFKQFVREKYQFSKKQLIPVNEVLEQIDEIIKEEQE